MSLRAKFIIYLTSIHLVFAGVSVYFLLERREWLLAVEAFFVLSFLVGLWLIHALFEPIRLIRSAAEFIRGREFSTRLREVGQKELDPLIKVYNLMADKLRQERIRGEEQEHFLQRIIAASPSGILIFDLDGRITMANPAVAALLRVDPDELWRRTLEEAGSALGDQLAGLAPGDSLLLSLQGRRRIRCSAFSFLDRGFARRFILMDELTEELHKSEKSAYEKLIRMMSHEVNNTTGAVTSLLNSCLVYGEQLGEGDRKVFADALGVAISRTGRMNRFMQEFADVVRLPAPRKRACDLQRLLEEIESLLREECRARQVRWEWDIREELPVLQLDPAQMEQALINICKNSLEAIGREGTLTIRLGRERRRPYLVIRDSGCGIPAGIRDQLFTPFFTSKKDGQGIGLTMVQEILLGHGLDFSLESAGKANTEFFIYF